MALVSKIRRVTKNGNRYITTRLMIWRGGREIFCRLRLQHIHEEAHQVIGGGKEAIRIFGLSERVLLKPIANQRFSHLITQ